MKQISKEILEDYLNYLTDIINDMAYSEIDCFVEDNNLSESQVNSLLALNLKVVIDKDDE